MKCDGTRAETKCCLSAKRTSPFKSAGALVQSTTGSRGVRISGSNAGHTMFQRWCEGYWLPTPFASFPFTSPPMRHRVPSSFNRTLPTFQTNLLSLTSQKTLYYMQWSRLTPTLVHKECVVDKVTLRQIYLHIV